VRHSASRRAAGCVQVRVAAVRAVRALVPCGAADAALALTGFEDPHYVPVRAFYGPCARANFCARLAVDASPQARQGPGCGPLDAFVQTRRRSPLTT
jgi:hypothetical protein